jgi:hypothetical protein
MATGVLPFRGETTGAIFEAILHGSPIAPVRLNLDVPAELERVISKSLDKDRKLRYQSATEMRVDLARLKRDRESTRHAITVTQPGGPASSAAQVTPVTGHVTAEGGVTPPVGVAAPSVTTSAPPHRRIPIWAAAVALVVIAAIGAGAWFYVHRAPALTGRDSVVLADFTNTTGDSVFDGSLREALAAKLAESPHFHIVSDASVRHTLRLMEQPPNARLTPDLARGICQREGSQVVLDGTISGIGDQYALTLEAVDCASDSSLARVEADASGKDQVLPALGTLAALAALFPRIRVERVKSTIRHLSYPYKKPSGQMSVTWTLSFGIQQPGRIAVIF